MLKVAFIVFLPIWTWLFDWW